MYSMHCVACARKYLTICGSSSPTQVETVGSSLDLGYVYVLDAGKRIYVWCGTKSPLMARSKARLICEKINKFERKNKSEIVQIRAVSLCVWSW